MMRRKRPKPETLDEYDFSCGVRGKYAELCGSGTNVVLLDPDVAEVFRDSKSVNDVLRQLAKIVKKVGQGRSHMK